MWPASALRPKALMPRFRAIKTARGKWNAFAQQVQADRIHLIVAHGAVVAGDENLFYFSRLIQFDGRIHPVQKYRRETAVYQNRRPRHQRRLRAPSVRNSIVYVLFCPGVNNEVGSKYEND